MIYIKKSRAHVRFKKGKGQGEKGSSSEQDHCIGAGGRKGDEKGGGVGGAGWWWWWWGGGTLSTMGAS